MKLNFTLFTLVEMFEKRIKKKKSNKIICREFSKVLDIPVENFEYLNACLSKSPKPLPIDRSMSFSIPVDEDFDRKISRLNINMKSDLISTLPIEMLASMHMRGNFKGLPHLDDMLLKSALESDFKCTEDVDKAWKSALSERFYIGERQSYDDYVIVPEIIKRKDKVPEVYNWLISDASFKDAVTGKYVSQYDGEDHHIQMLNVVKSINFDGVFNEDIVAVIKGQLSFCSFVEVDGKTQFNGYSRKSVSSFRDMEIPEIKMTLSESLGNFEVLNKNIRTIYQIQLNFERELNENEKNGLSEFFYTMLANWRESSEVLNYAKALSSKLEIEKVIEKTQYRGENTTDNNFKL